MKKLLFILLLSLPIFAGNLQLKDGYVTAHTTMMWEDIEPKNENLYAQVEMQNGDITSLRGKFWVDMNFFISDKLDRDEHMYEALEVDKFENSTFTISNVTKADENNSYVIDGVLNFYGVDKNLKADAVIVYKDEILTLDANSSMLVTDFGMQTVCKFFMCVDDKVDFKVNAQFQ